MSNPLIPEPQSMIDARNRLLAEVEECGVEFALSWLKGAYHSNGYAAALLRQRLQELREFALRHLSSHTLTAAEARLLGVCRVCRRGCGPGGGACVLNYGDEFAHRSCLDKESTGG